MSFNIASNRSTEFAVAVNRGEDPFYLVPTNGDVQGLLLEMLRQTLSKFSSGGDVEDIEYGEEYSSETSLRCAVDDPVVKVVVDLFNRDGLTSRSAALEHPELIDFYFARFFDDQGNRCMGVKTPSQFKGTIGKRLITLLGDELVVVENRLFKLDNTFDFIVLADQVLILNPKQFIRVADVDRVLQTLTPVHIQEAAQFLTVVDFDHLRDYIISHSRAQRLLSSIRKRTTLAQVTAAMITTQCSLNHIPILEFDGKIIPVPGFESAFLELLDGRRYKYPFDDGTPELYRALRRNHVP